MRLCHLLSLSAGLISVIFSPLAHADDLLMVENARTYAGMWRVEDPLKSKACRIAFSQRLLMGGEGVNYALSVDPICADADSLFTHVQSWKPGPGGGIIMLDHQGQIIFEWAISELDGLESIRPSNVFLTLTPTEQRENIITIAHNR